MKKFLFLAIACSLLTQLLFAATIILPKPQLQKNLYLDQAIAKRRSVRHFSSKPLTFQQLSQLLWATQGITAPKAGFRAAPSAGALYPLELYVVKADGVWHYNIQKHALSLLTDKDLRKPLAETAINQQYVALAPVDLVMTATFKRVTKKYGPRGFLFSYVETGHAAENYLLEATALGLGAVPIGGFYPDKVRALLDLQRNEEPVYIIATGYPSKK